MFGYLLNSIGLATVTTYTAVNYLTYQTINNIITTNQNLDRLNLKPVYFSPIFNYHTQLQKQLQKNYWSYMTMRPTNFRIKDTIFPFINFSMNIDECSYGYAYRFGNYQFSFVKELTKQEDE